MGNEGLNQSAGHAEQTNDAPATAALAAPDDGSCVAITPVPNLDDSSLFLHRELSQLQFNIRVLEQALDESTP